MFDFFVFLVLINGLWATFCKLLFFAAWVCQKTAEKFVDIAVGEFGINILKNPFVVL